MNTREPIPKIAKVSSIARGITEFAEMAASQFEFNNDSILDQSINFDSSLNNRTNFLNNKKSNNDTILDNCTNRLKAKDTRMKNATICKETVSDPCEKLVEICFGFE